MKYRFVVNDLEKSLQQTFDDAEVSQVQILYWIQVIANRLRSDYYKIKGDDTYISTFAPVSVNTDSQGNKYFDLPTQILDLKNDAGIVFISYNFETCCCGGDPKAQVQFSRTTVSKLPTLYMEPYTVPSAKNPFFYRIGDRVNGVSVNRVYLLGFECTNIKDVQIGILASMNPTTVCDLDDELPIPDELVHELITEVLQLGRFVMLVPEERLNDGSDTNGQQIPKVPSAPALAQGQMSEEQY